VNILREVLLFPFTTHPEFPLLSKGEKCDTSVYKKCVQAFEYFNCITPLDYSKICTKTSVLLLGDVLRHFVLFCTNYFNLSPLHSIILPAFAFDAAFCHSGAEFEFIKDEDIIAWVTTGIRAGISFSNGKCATSNCERLNCFNGNSAKRSHIIEIDLTAAYPDAMTGPLATGSHTWIDEETIKQMDILNLPDEGEYGYILWRLTYGFVGQKHDELNLWKVFVKFCKLYRCEVVHH